MGAVPEVSPRTLKGWLVDGQEIALLDVREAGQFGEGHLFYAVPFAFSRIELDAARLVPRKDTRIVLVDEAAGDLAARAARRLQALGYTDVHVLQGGTPAWREAGYVLFQGVNLPSKTFGELVEHELDTPRISAQELARRQSAGEPMVVLDGRPYAEFAKMSIPGAVCCPNGELALRIGRLAPDPAVTIVVNCAGRTRSIIGAQTLINFGVPNPVFALENGTQGWYLAEHKLDHGRSVRHDDEHRPDDLADRRARASRLAQRCGVERVDAKGLRNLLADASRSTFVLDVRTPHEFAADAVPGVQHAPGGQLMQATDQYVGVRGARLVLADDEDVRAPVVASWLRQMGHQAFVFEGGVSKLREALGPEEHARTRSQGMNDGHRRPSTGQQAAALPTLTGLDAATLAERLAAGTAMVFDLRPSMSHRRSHIPGSRWSIRQWIVQDVRDALAALSKGAPIPAVVLVADEPALAQAAALELGDAAMPAPLLLDGGFDAWRAAGLPVAATPASPPDARCIDYLFFVHDRHEGNAEAARKYLAWETGLIAQLDADELANFRIVDPR